MPDNDCQKKSWNVPSDGGGRYHGLFLPKNSNEYESLLHLLLWEESVVVYVEPAVVLGAKISSFPHGFRQEGKQHEHTTLLSELHSMS